MKLRLLPSILVISSLAISLSFGVYSASYSGGPYVLFTFDDAWTAEICVKTVLPILDSYGWKAIGLFHTGGSIPFDYFKNYVEILAENGWEIGSHSHTHRDMNCLTSSELEFECSESKRLLESLPSVDSVETFSYPYSAGFENETVSNVVKRYFTYQRPQIEWAERHYGFVDPLGVVFTGNLIGVTNAVAWAKENNRNVWLLFHGVGGTKQTTISVDEFKKCCRVIEDSGLPVTTMRDLNNPPNNPPQTWEITVFRDGIPIFNEVTSDSTRLKELIDIYKDQDEIVIQRLG